MTSSEKVKNRLLNLSEMRGGTAKGAINMRLFLHLGTLPVCQTKDKKPAELKHCCADIMVEREVATTIDCKRSNYNRDQNKGNRGGGGRGGYQGKSHYNDGFEKGTAKKGGDSKTENWLQEDN